MADIEQNKDTRISLCNQIEQKLVDDIAWLPLDQRNGTHVLKSYVIGQAFNAQDLIPPDNWDAIYIANRGYIGKRRSRG